VHELLHIVAFSNLTDDETGRNTSGFTLPMDRLMEVGADGLVYFTGEQAMAEFGGPVPLASGSLAHLGEPFGLGKDIMYPFAYNGYREQISDLNLAMMNDMGIATIPGRVLDASAGSDSLAGTAATDHIYVSVSDVPNTVDVFAGGLGHDVVHYAAQRADYAIRAFGDSADIEQNSSVDHLSSIERVEFADGTLLFDFNSTNADAAYRLYGGAFDRTPDEGGLRFWTFDWLNSGGTLHDAAAHFIGSDEFIATYGDRVSNADFVAQLYQNILDRPGEESGQTFWQGYLSERDGDRADVLVHFTQLPEYVGLSAADIDNGYWVAVA